MKLVGAAALRGLPLLCGILLGGAAAATAERWEKPVALDASTLLGRSAIAGKHFKIEPRVESDGLMNRYVVSSSYQRIGAYGDSLALERAREQEAMAALREIKTMEAYADGLKAAARAPLAVTRQVLTDPVAVMKSVPSAVSNLWSDVSGAFRGAREGAERKRDTSQMMKELIGLQRVKARLAFELGVDVYSSNAVLQTDLDDVSWSTFAGGASLELAMTQAPLAASLSKTALEAIDDARAPLWAIPPATLMHETSKAFQAMGLSPDEADAIAWHRTCTLTHQTLLASILTELRGVGGRDDFANLAATADDEAECRFYVETAKLAWSYHHMQRPIKTLRVSDGIVTAKDADGKVVLLLRADYVFWTPQAGKLVKALPASGKRSLWLSGVLSEAARRGFEQRGVVLHERVSKRFPAEVDVAAVLVPERAETSDE